MTGVFILQESITVENRKLLLENDEAQTQKLIQGRIIIKIDIFHRNFIQNWIFSWFCKKKKKKTEKRHHTLSRKMDIWVIFLKFAFFVNTFVRQRRRFSPSVHSWGILDSQFVLQLYLTVPNSIVEFSSHSKSGLWSKICQPHPEIS